MEDSVIALSALQHFLYCPRQCALIHLERQWAENRQTAEGRLLHERADKTKTESRSGVRTVTAMPLANDALGIAGVADVVEFHQTSEGEKAFPVEYKRGKPKLHRADEVQLCAQALCLEEMLGYDIKDGALFYGKTRRRKAVVFDETLRNLTKQVIENTKQLFVTGITPLPVYESHKCDACSLFEICRPKELTHAKPVEQWLSQHLKD